MTQASSFEGAEVRAAGGVVWRRAPGGPCELVVVHRPRYDDWSLPKGKLDDGETWEGAAVREVEEETGLRCRIAEELPGAAYRDRHGRGKVVRYWLMRPTADDGFAADDEVDERRWVTFEDALGLLSYESDREVVAAALTRIAGRRDAGEGGGPLQTDAAEGARP